MRALLETIWSSLQGDSADLDGVGIVDRDIALPSIYDVTGLAAATVSAACLAVAELSAARSGRPRPDVSVDSRDASAAFVSERLFEPIGWERPPIWDPIAGDYRASDGWIRLHTNYANHRAAVLSVLGLDDGADQAVVAPLVAVLRAAELEQAVVDAGGAAAVMRSRKSWAASDAGRSGVNEPLVRISAQPNATPRAWAAPSKGLPLSGLRVLDLTRVIAGPVCTRFLAAYGADVLRIDPPDFVEVPSLVPETSVGKRCAALDLTTAAGRDAFAGLVADADVIVSGLRSDAMTRLGFDSAALRAINPAIVSASLDAYGWEGPWTHRRGFDSLVQMSVGIAAAGAAAASVDRPTPLPAQALDHGTGYLLAAAVCRSLTRLVGAGEASDVRCSLVGTANLLMQTDAREAPAPTFDAADTVHANTAWGPVRRAGVPGEVEGTTPRYAIDAGPLGRDLARFSE